MSTIPTADLEQLYSDLLAGTWIPTPEELVAGLAVARLPELSAVGIRRAVDPARRTRSRFVVVMESVATVLSLPTLHEELTDRVHLVRLAEQLAQEVVDRDVTP